MNRAIFLDRDNTIIQALSDPTDTRSVTLIKGAASAIASLRGLGYRIIVITNQGGVARGEITEEDVEKINQRIHELVKQNSNTRIDRFYYCPYDPQGTIERFAKDHPWRKPNPGMIVQAARDFQVDVKQSWTVGDSLHDIQAGIAAGTRTVLLQPGAVVQVPPGVGTSPRSTAGAAGRARRQAANADLAGEPVPGSLHGSELPSPIIMPETTLSAAPAEKAENATVDSQQIIERAQAIGVDFIAQSLTEAVRLIAQSRRHDISDPAKTATAGEATTDEPTNTPATARASRSTTQAAAQTRTTGRSPRKTPPPPPEVPPPPEGPPEVPPELPPEAAPEGSSESLAEPPSEGSEQASTAISTQSAPEASSPKASGSETQPAPARSSDRKDAKLTDEQSAPAEPLPTEPGAGQTAAVDQAKDGREDDDKPEAAVVSDELVPPEPMGEVPAETTLAEAADQQESAATDSRDGKITAQPASTPDADQPTPSAAIDSKADAKASIPPAGKEAAAADDSKTGTESQQAALAGDQPSLPGQNSPPGADELESAGGKELSSRSPTGSPDREPDEEEPWSARSARDEQAVGGAGADTASTAGRWGRRGTSAADPRPNRPAGSRHRATTEAAASAVSTTESRGQPQPDEPIDEPDRMPLTGIRTRDIPAEQTLREILQELRNQRRTEAAEFGLLDGVALLIQLIAVVCVAAGLMLGVGGEDGLFWRGIGLGLFCQLIVIAILLFKKDR